MAENIKVVVIPVLSFTLSNGVAVVSSSGISTVQTGTPLVSLQRTAPSTIPTMHSGLYDIDQQNPVQAFNVVRVGGGDREGHCNITLGNDKYRVACYIDTQVLSDDNFTVFSYYNRP